MGEIVAQAGVEGAGIERQESFFGMKPRDQVARASEIASVLNDIIEKQGLSVKLGAKKYVRAEGWQTLGNFLGILPREQRVIRHEDGSYEAHIDLIKYSDGAVVGGASAICGVDEERWGKAAEYARRSMAITRAVGKAYRTSFSWIVTLAGYEPTPAEEMHQEERSESYTGTTAQQEKIKAFLKKRGIPEEGWAEIDRRMQGLQSKDVPRILKELGYAASPSN